ncbi:Serine/threonine protein kinase [Quillaja saponaria]|uniref:Serine/threonine protein kinase n=1 Tax=Quillaja saponaria TaxID=32244 RepID=A0AAD7VN90_QUISA|nr:Serine/threonine protein kinase [Quillaja saponaria]
MADCFDVDYSDDHTPKKVKLIHEVNEGDNRLGILNTSTSDIEATNVDHYAAHEVIYLGKKCQVQDTPMPWQFWMIMLKGGNTDTLAAICPENGEKVNPFPCFGKGCMNMPLTYHNYISVQDENGNILGGSFYGTWDLDTDVTKGIIGNDTSYYPVK